MPSTTRRRLLALATGALGALAGCAGLAPSRDSPAGDRPTGGDTETTPAASPTPTAFPGDGVEFPDGPKAPPERPDPLTADSVREYVREFEYRYAYNSLYAGPNTAVSLTCEVESVEERGPGYRATVQCSGYADTRGESTAEGTATATVVHADWGTQTVVYLVDEDTTVRRRESWG